MGTERFSMVAFRAGGVLDNMPVGLGTAAVCKDRRAIAALVVFARACRPGKNQDLPFLRESA
jgi:hypothetical protein